MAVSFIDCESLSISYNEMGIATVNYVLIADSDDFSLPNTIVAGGRTFDGYVMTAFQQPIPNTSEASSGGWYTINVTMVAIAN